MELNGFRIETTYDTHDQPTKRSSYSVPTGRLTDKWLFQAGKPCKIIQYFTNGNERSVLTLDHTGQPSELRQKYASGMLKEVISLRGEIPKGYEHWAALMPELVSTRHGRTILYFESGEKQWEIEYIDGMRVWEIEFEKSGRARTEKR